MQKKTHQEKKLFNKYNIYLKYNEWEDGRLDANSL